VSRFVKRTNSVCSTSVIMGLWDIRSFATPRTITQQIPLPANLFPGEWLAVVQAGTMKKRAARRVKPREKVASGRSRPSKRRAAEGAREVRGGKGNLRFPLDEPVPYPLIRRVVPARLKALRAKQATAKRR
jgi:hypothetical protein